jgi:hypothetical protein
MPGHSDKQTAIVAPVGRPPFLRVGHELIQVFLQGNQINLFEFFSILEVLAHRVGGWRVLMKDAQV